MEWFNKKVLFIFASSSILWQVTFVITEFVILRLVDPEYIGIWQLILLIQGYSLISRLGILNAMNREFPFSLGQQNTQRAKIVSNTTLYFSLINGFILSLFFFILSLFYKTNDQNWRVALLSMAFIVFFEIINNYLESILRGVNKFQLLSKYQLSLIPIAIISLLLPWEYNFIGLCIRAVFISLFKGTILLIISYKYLNVPKFNFGMFKELFQIGWKLWLWNYIKNLVKSFPRLAIATFSTTTILGLYAPVNWVSMGFTSLAGSISSYIYPNLSFQLAKGEHSVGYQSLKIAKYTILIFLPVTIIGIILIPYFIPVLLPKYIAAITAMQVSLVAGLLESLNLATTAFATLKAWKAMFYHTFIGLVLKGSLIFSFYFLFEDKLLGVSTGLCIASVFMFGVTWIMVKRLDN